MRRIAEDAYIDAAAARTAPRWPPTPAASTPSSPLTCDNLPVEFTLLGYQPRPWSVVDSLLICLHMFRDLTTTWRDEI